MALKLRSPHWHWLLPTMSVVVVGVLLYWWLDVSTQPVQRQADTAQLSDEQPLKPVAADPQLTTDDADSIYRLINADYRLPAEYEPSDLVLPDISLDSRNPQSQLRLRAEAAEALKRMFLAAKAEAGFDLQLASGYRPYSTQLAIYNSSGGANQTLVAVPGGSEHQSGLAADIKRQDFTCRLEECFGNQPEGIWVAANAHQFGYVLRYPEGKEDVTGISYEAWHFRYVGEDLAEILHAEELALEEYYQRQVQ